MRKLVTTSYQQDTRFMLHQQNTIDTHAESEIFQSCDLPGDICPFITRVTPPPPKKNHLKHSLNIIYSGLIYMYEYSTQNFIHTFVRYIDTRLKHVTRQREVSKRGAWSDIRDKKKGIIITTDLE